MPNRVLYRVWAYPVGPPQHQSVAAASFQGQPTDAPAVLIVCDTPDDRDRLIAELRRRDDGPHPGR
jgi:hypothetical protein